MKFLLLIFAIFAVGKIFGDSDHGLNAPEGLILTRATTTTKKPTTQKPTTTKQTTKKQITTKMITTKEITTLEATTKPTQQSTKLFTTTVSSTLAELTTSSNKKQKKAEKAAKKKSKKEAKAKKRKAKEDSKSKSTNNLKGKNKKAKEKSKELKKKAKENKKKAKADKKKLKETNKKVKKKMKAERKKTKILFRQAKAKLKELKRQTRRKLRLTDKALMKEFLRNCTLLFRSIRLEHREKKLRMKSIGFTNTSTEEVPPNGFEIVQTMNNFGKNLAAQLKSERKRKRKRKEVLPISSDGIEMEVSVLETTGFDGYRFPDVTSGLNVNDSIELPSNIFKRSPGENATIISFVYDAFYEMTKENEEDVLRSPFVNSKIVSTTVEPRPTQSLANPVEIILNHLQKPNGTTPECVFWKVNESNPESGRWSTEGCKVHKSNETHTVCHCNHLTDFAVLFNVAETAAEKIPVVHRQALTIVSMAGCLISSVCLMITVIVFIVLRKLLRSTRNLIHFNLAIALLVANIFLLLSGQATANSSVCISISLCLFYFFLSAFCWMLGEGIFIWIMVAKAFSENLKAWMYLFIGWGFPFIIVAVAFGILKFELINTEFCWLSVEKSAIWAFAGPVLFVITINFAILIKVLCTAIEHQSTEGRLKVSARLTLLLLPILGLTWLFGFMSMIKDTIAFQYLFTFFNSCQGIFIFLCYIALNAEVKHEYQKWMAKREYSQSLQLKTSSTGGTSGDRRSRFGTQNELTQLNA